MLPAYKLVYQAHPRECGDDAVTYPELSTQ